MSRSTLPPLNTAGAALLAATLLAAPLLTPGLAQAREEDPTTAAQVDQMLRPHFDFLEHRRRVPPGQPPYYRRPVLQDTVLADCAKGDTVDDALYRVNFGGTVMVRGTCVERQALMLDIPVRIVGEAQSPFDGVAGAEARIKTPPGAPCAVVSTQANAKVSLQDVTLVCDQAGRRSGIEMGEDAALTLVRVKMDYIGQKSAITAGSGQLNIADSVINAMSYDPAVVTDGTHVAILNTLLRTGSTGLVVTPGVGAQVDLDHVSIWSNTSVDDLTNEPEIGIVVRGAGTFFKGNQNALSSEPQPPNFVLKHTDIYGYKVGVEIQRGIVGAAIETTRIRHAVYGVLSSADNLNFKDSAVSAAHTGVQVNSGNAWILRNAFIFGALPSKAIEFAGPTGTVDHAPAAQMIVEHNWFYAKSGCQVLPDVHPWCGPIPDILMAGNPTDGPVKPGWDGVPFVLPAAYQGVPSPPRGDDHKGHSFFGLSLGARAGGSVEPDVHH